METNGSVLLEESGPPSAPQPPRQRGLGLFFQSSQTETEESPLLPAEESLSGLPLQPDGASGSVSGWQTVEPDEAGPSEAETSSPASSASPLGKKATRLAARQAVLVAGGVAHSLLAKTEGQMAAALYVADDEDAERIGDPLADIAGRHSGVTGAANPDVADGIRAMLGFAGYMTKQFQRTLVAREHDRQQLTAGPRPVQAVDL